MIGAKADLTYTYDYLGAGTDRSSDLAAGKHSFADVLKARKIRSCWSARVHRAARWCRGYGAAAKLALDFGAVKDGWNGFGVLHDTASRVGALDIGFAADAGGLSTAQMTTFGTLDVLFLLGADEVKVPTAPLWFTSAPMATVARIVPTSSCRARPTLKSPAFTSTPKAGCRWPTALHSRRGMRGRTGRSFVRCRSPRQKAALRFACGVAAGHLQGRAASDARRPDRSRQGHDLKTLAGKGGSLEKAPFKASVKDYYLTNPIARASAVMAECSRLASGQMLTAAE